jgi:hypothetical protein
MGSSRSAECRWSGISPTIENKHEDEDEHDYSLRQDEVPDHNGRRIPIKPRAPKKGNGEPSRESLRRHDRSSVSVGVSLWKDLAQRRNAPVV